jgi:hypothetical protein
MTSGDGAGVGDQKPVTLGCASAGEGRGIARRGLGWLLGMAGVCGLLTLASFLVVYSNATEEPYYGTIRAFDMLQQVGLGSVLVVLWVTWCGGLIALVQRGKVHPGVLGALLWSLIVIVYLGWAVDGYISDVIKFQTTPSLQQGWQRPGGDGNSAGMGTGGAATGPG